MQVLQQGPFTALLPADCDVDVPLVILGAWAGANDRAISKYAELLARHNYPSVRSVLPTTHIFSPIAWPRRQWALDLLCFIESNQLSPPRRLVVYSFSNGGAYVLEQLIALSQSHPAYCTLPKRILGFIFDSAPAYMHPETAVKVLQTHMPPSIGRSMLMATVSIGTAWDAVWSLNGMKRKDRFWHAMLSTHWDRPSLFLYSDDDPLCDARKLDELITAKQAAGQDVTHRRWANSEHCGHWKRHKIEYEQLLLEFLQKCRNKNKGSTRPQAKL